MNEKDDFSLNPNEFEKYTWEVIKKYFEQDKGNHIIKHILASYNDFVFKKIDDIINGFNPIEIFHHYIEDKDLYKYQIEITIKNPKISKPIIHEKNGKYKIMTPNEARQRNLCYSGNLYVDMKIQVQYIDIDTNHINNNDINDDTNDNTNNETNNDTSNDTNDDTNDDYNVICKDKEIKNINLGKIPIMVNSNYCVLNKQPEFRKNNECLYDHGGYFIINGNEKVIVSQDRIAENKTYVFKDNKASTYSYVAEIRSVPDNIFSPPKLTILKLSAKETQFGKYIRVVIHHVKQDIPIFILFRALGIESDKEIIEYILYDLEDKNNLDLIKYLKGSVEEANNCLYKNHAMEYLSNYLSITGYPKEMLTVKNRKLSILNYILKDDFLPHVGDNFNNKALYLGYMINKLIKCSINILPLDDRDSYINKRIDTPGILMSNLFRQYYGKVVRDMKMMIYKEIQHGSWKVNNNYLDIIKSTNIYKIMKSSIIEGGYKYSLATGNWGIKNQLNKNKQGVAQVLNRLTYMATLSHLRRVNTPMEKNGKLIHPRKLHPTQWGIICPSETPEGGSIGLVKNLSMMATISISSDTTIIKNFLKEYKTIFFNGERNLLKDFNEYTHIILNGNILGYHKNPKYLFNILKKLKRKGVINVYTSISWNYQENKIYLNSESGRAIRPTYIVDNKDNKNILRFNKYHILKILNNNINFTELFDLNNDNLNTDKCCIEFLDVEENNTSMVAINFKDLLKGFRGNTYPSKFNYLELHPSLILGLCASNIPFPDHNQAPRNTYQASMGKQAIGVYSSNFNYRMDTLGNILNYPQIPLVKTKISDITNCNELPCGINVIVAIACFTGFNQEDSIMINKSAVDRGLFNSTFFRTYKDQCNKNHSTGEEEKYCNPDPDITKGYKPFNYNKLTDEGFVRENTYVENNDIIIGKTMPIKKSENEAYQVKDNSVSLKQNESGFIDKSYSNNKYFQNTNNEGYKFSKIKIRANRIPTIGDKLCLKETSYVLTDIGWIQLKDIDITKHYVATLENNENLNYVKPTEKYEYDCIDEELYHIQSQQINIYCTKNHKLYIQKRDKKNYELIEAKDVFGKRVRFKKNAHNNNPDIEYMIFDKNKYDMNNFLKFLGSFISDGWVDEGDKHRRIAISMSKLRKKIFIENTLNQLNINYNMRSDRVLIGNNYKEVVDYFKKLSVGASNKYLPNFVWKLSQKQSIILLESLIQGDGHIDKNGCYSYCTSSIILANDIQKLALHCGWSGTIKLYKGREAGRVSIIKDRTITSKYDNFIVRIVKKKNEPQINHGHTKKQYAQIEEYIKYTGKVACIEVPNTHLFYYKEDLLSPPCWTGNSSRHGQKGIIGMIYEQKDMPFNKDGLCPDIIINPHAIPSRMTIAQLLECIMSKACISLGTTGNATAFTYKNANQKRDDIGEILQANGLNRHCDDILYNPFTGEQIHTNIFFGPTYYQRLKHMVKDKIHSRSANGPIILLTRQPTEGRAREGGLRLGEMEVECSWAHGSLSFLKERLLECSDNYRLFVCKNCCNLSNVNEDKKIFKCYQCGNTTDFSQIRIPYACKLLFQEIEAMSINTKFITK